MPIPVETLIKQGLISPKQAEKYQLVADVPRQPGITVPGQGPAGPELGPRGGAGYSYGYRGEVMEPSRQGTIRRTLETAPNGRPTESEPMGWGTKTDRQILKEGASEVKDARADAKAMAKREAKSPGYTERMSRVRSWSIRNPDKDAEGDDMVTSDGRIMKTDPDLPALRMTNTRAKQEQLLREKWAQHGEPAVWHEPDGPRAAFPGIKKAQEYFGDDESLKYNVYRPGQQKY